MDMTFGTWNVKSHYYTTGSLKTAASELVKCNRSSGSTRDHMG